MSDIALWTQVSKLPSEDGQNNLKGWADREAHDSTCGNTYSSSLNGSIVLDSCNAFSLEIPHGGSRKLGLYYIESVRPLITTTIYCGQS